MDEVGERVSYSLVAHVIFKNKTQYFYKLYLQ